MSYWPELTPEQERRRSRIAMHLCGVLGMLFLGASAFIAEFRPLLIVAGGFAFGLAVVEHRGNRREG